MSHDFFIFILSEKSFFHIWKLNIFKTIFICIFLKKIVFPYMENEYFQIFSSHIFGTGYFYLQNTVNLQNSVSTGFQIYINVQISISTGFRFTLNLLNSFSTGFQIYKNVQILISTCFRFIAICRFQFLQILERHFKREMCILNIFRVLLFTFIQIMYSKHSRSNQKKSGFRFLIRRIMI